MSTKAINTAASASAPPPPYEQLTPTIKSIGKCISEQYSEEWQYITFPHPLNNSWHKIIRGADERATEIHLGISDTRSKTTPTTTGPDCFFVCKLAPRSVKVSKQEIADVCAGIPCSAGRHRGKEGKGYCTCTFRDFRLGDRVHCCGKVGWWERFAKWVNARSVRRLMADHDRLCSCGCFDAWY